VHKAKWYESPACFKQSDVPVNWYVSRQVTLPVPICHLPKSSVKCDFCNVKYTSDGVSPVICMIVVLYLSWSLTHTHDKRTEWHRLCIFIAGLHKKPTFCVSAVRATSRTLLACNISLVSLTLLSPQARNFVELILLYTQKTTHPWIV